MKERNHQYIDTDGYGPDGSNLHHGFGPGVEAAVLDGVTDGDVAVQRNGAQVHDGSGGEQHVQIDPDGAQGAGKGPGVICFDNATKKAIERETRRAKRFFFFFFGRVTAECKRSDWPYSWWGETSSRLTVEDIDEGDGHDQDAHQHVGHRQ